MRDSLQAVILMLGASLNAWLTFEGIEDKSPSWKIAISGMTAIGLLAMALYRIGLFGLRSI